MNSRPSGMPAEPANLVPVVVNGERTRTSAATLAMLITELGYDQVSVATAVNGDFVPRDARVGRPIAADDAIEIVAPRQGG